MKTIRTGFLAITALVVPAFNGQAAPIVYSASGPDAAAISSAVGAFQAALGTLNANLPVSFSDGRREINWDAVPQAASSPNAFPGNFFNGTVPGRARGVAFTTPGTGFQVSANAGEGPVQFANIDPGYPDFFEPFSQQKLFTPIGSTITDVQFFLPGTTTPAVTDGFGVVFSDVDVFARLTFFDLGGNAVDYDVPTATGNETFSFLGVAFDAPVISRVRIVSGNLPLEPGGLSTDRVTMDDFIFGEPQATPDAGCTLSLLTTGLGALGLARRLRSNIV